MSIFDLFRGGANPNAVQKQAGNQDPMNPQNPNLQNQNPQMQQPLQQPNQQSANQNPQVPAANPANPQSPAVEFQDLWTIDPKQKGPADLGDFSFQFDPAKVEQQVAGLDFTRNLSPDLLAKINAGGPEAMSALLAAMNVVGQQAMKTSLLASTRITETGIKNSGQRIKDNLPGLVRNESVSNALREDNPLFNDPATAPIMEAITQQFTQKFPNATPQEIREQAKKYMVNFAGTAAKFGGKQVVDQQVQQNSGSGAPVQTDWSSEPTF